MLLHSSCCALLLVCFKTSSGSTRAKEHQQAPQTLQHRLEVGMFQVTLKASSTTPRIFQKREWLLSVQGQCPRSESHGYGKCPTGSSCDNFFARRQADQRLQPIAEERQTTNRRAHKVPKRFPSTGQGRCGKSLPHPATPTQPQRLGIHTSLAKSGTPGALQPRHRVGRTSQ